MLASGTNHRAPLGDGTFAARNAAVATTGLGNAEALDLTPENPVDGDRVPVFRVIAKGDVSAATPASLRRVHPRAQDVGASRNVYVFAIAPARS